MIKNFFTSILFCGSLISFNLSGCVLEKAEEAFKQIAKITEGELSFNCDELRTNLKTVLTKAIEENIEGTLGLRIYEAFLKSYRSIEYSYKIPSEMCRDALLGFLVIGHQVLIECIKEKKDKNFTPLAIPYFSDELKGMLNDFCAFQTPLTEDEKSDEVMTESSEGEEDDECNIKSLNDQYEQIGREREECLKAMQEEDALY